MRFLMQYDDVTAIPRWRTDAVLKIVFLVISRDGQSEIWKGDEEAHADIGHVTKTAIFWQIQDGRRPPF